MAFQGKGNINRFGWFLFGVFCEYQLTVIDLVCWLHKTSECVAVRRNSCQLWSYIFEKNISRAEQRRWVVVMKCHQVLTGACNVGDRTFGVGSVEGVSTIAYAAGCNITVSTSLSPQRLTIMSHLSSFRSWPVASRGSRSYLGSAITMYRCSGLSFDQQ